LEYGLENVGFRKFGLNYKGIITFIFYIIRYLEMLAIDGSKFQDRKSMVMI
jgi:hypothetical protein